jgi:hypothetical protein
VERKSPPVASNRRRGQTRRSTAGDRREVGPCPHREDEGGGGGVVRRLRPRGGSAGALPPDVRRLL